MGDPEISINGSLTLDEIVGFCRAVQERFQLPSNHQEERRKYQRALVDLCRRCRDQTCPKKCEVKKAYEATLPPEQP